MIHTVHAAQLGGRAGPRVARAVCAIAADKRLPPCCGFSRSEVHEYPRSDKKKILGLPLVFA